MKKTMFLFLTLMMLGINSVTAQNHIGKWVVGQEFSKLMNDDPNEERSLGLVFTAKDINLQITVKSSDEEMTMKCMFTIPGTYTKSGKNVVAKYEIDKATIKIIDIKTNDAEMNELLASKEGRDMVFKMIETQAGSQIKNQINEFDEFFSLFDNFTIEEVTASELTLGMKEGTMIGFDRTN